MPDPLVPLAQIPQVEIGTSLSAFLRHPAGFTASTAALAAANAYANPASVPASGSGVFVFDVPPGKSVMRMAFALTDANNEDFAARMWGLAPLHHTQAAAVSAPDPAKHLDELIGFHLADFGVTAGNLSPSTAAGRVFGDVSNAFFADTIAVTADHTRSPGIRFMGSASDAIREMYFGVGGLAKVIVQIDCNAGSSACASACPLYGFL